MQISGWMLMEAANTVAAAAGAPAGPVDAGSVATEPVAPEGAGTFTYVPADTDSIGSTYTYTAAEVSEPPAEPEDPPQR